MTRYNLPSVPQLVNRTVSQRWLLGVCLALLNSACTTPWQAPTGAVPSVGSGSQPELQQVAESAPEPCPELTSANLDLALAQLQSALTLPHCHERATGYFEELLTIAADAPALSNRKRFDQLFRQLDSAGVISKAQATRWYTQYFSTSFMALPDTYNVCSAGRQQDKILQAMRDELRLKERGLLQVLGDKSLYFTARQRHDEIGLILQTTTLACQDHS